MTIDLSALPDKREEPETPAGSIDLSGLPNRRVDTLKQAYRSDTTLPDQEAKVVSLSRATGLPTATVRNNPGKAERLANEPDWNALDATAPNLVRQLAGNPDLFRVAKGDLVPLSTFERTLRAVPAAVALATLGIAEGMFRTPEMAQRAARSGSRLIEGAGPSPYLNQLRALTGAAGAAEGVAGAVDVAAGPIADTIANARTLLSGDQATFGDAFARLSLKGEEADTALKEALGGDLSGLGDVFTDPEAVAGFIGQALPSLLLAMKSGGSIPFIAFLEGSAKASEIAAFEQLKKGEIDDADYVTAIGQTALIGAFLERTGLDAILRKAGPGWLSQLGKVGGAAAVEGLTETLQEFNSNLATMLSYDPSQDLGEGLVASFIGGAGAGGGTSTVDALVNGASKQLAEKQIKVGRADRIKNIAATLTAMARDSKLRETNPEVFEETVGKIAENTEAAEVFIDVENLVSFYQEQGMDINDAFEQLPEVRRQIEEQLALGGGDVVIPVEQLATRLVDRPEDLGLVDHIRFDSESMSNFEAESFKQSSHEELAEEASRIVKKNTENEAFLKSVKIVEDATFEQLQGAKRFNSDVNRAYAAAVGNMYTVLGERLGLSPEATAAKYPIDIQGMMDRGSKIVFKQSGETRKLSELLKIADPNVPLDKLRQQERAYLDNLKGEIERDGLRMPLSIRVDDRGREIIDDGMHRLAVLEELGYDEIPVQIDGRRALAGAPEVTNVPGRGPVEFGVFEPAREAARKYAEKSGIPVVELNEYARVDPRRAKRIADEFDAMEHAPNDPEVKAAYRAMIDETMAQYETILETGLQIEFIAGPDPYATPFDAILDVVEKNHLFVFSTREGFGSDSTFDVSDNPLLEETEFLISGQKALANDIFRVVHDYFGHIKNGVGFRATGEENAWQSHAAMYSPLARRAMTTETRGQNSWVNFGPHGEKNRTASSADTVYADQKLGLLPEWVSEEGRLSGQENQQATQAGEKAATEGTGQATDVESAVSNGDRRSPPLNRLFQSPTRKAQQNDIGMYSAVEKAVLDMRLPEWKKEDGRASGKSIWQKLQTMPGVKKEELEWLGIEQWLSDPTSAALNGGKFTRDQVAEFVRQNGVRVVEVRADQETSEAQGLDWDNGTVWEDEEAWSHIAEDYMDEFDNGNSGLSGQPFHWFDVDEWLLNHRQEIVDNYDFDNYELGAEDAAIILDEDTAIDEIVAIIERNGFDLYEDMRADMRDDAEETANQAAYSQYMENPVYIFTAETPTIDLFIFGNDDQGYDIREGSWQDSRNVIRGTSGIYSLSEAQVQAEGYARENDLITDENSPNVAKWVDYIYDDRSADNYRELKLTLPDVAGEFVEDAHFEDPNIVAFLRVTDRELVVDPERKETPASGEYLTEENKANLAALSLYEKTFFIDEFQSDWHQGGRQVGYATGGVDVVALVKQAHDILLPIDEKLKGIWEAEVEVLHKDNRWANNPTAESGLGDKHAFTQRVYEIARNNGEIPDQYRIIPETEIFGSEFRQGKNYIKAKDVFDAQSELTWAEVKAVALESDALQKRADVESDGVPDAPFKGNGWIELGLKRAIIDAVENGYEALSWADSNMLVDRWSERYRKLYEIQYDQKMPSIVKKLTGENPKHLTWEGNEWKAVSELGNPASEIGYWAIPITDELRQKIQADGLPLFQGGNRGEFIPDTRTIVLLEQADLSTFIHELGHFQLEVLAEIAGQKDGPEDIKRDMQTLLDWFGIGSLATWQRMTLDQKREHHEKFARGFESYLFKGDVPNPRMADIFSRFRSWLVRIYKQLMNLNVTVTPEVKIVFDRLVATEDQIAEAEALQGYRALFKSEADAGMTPAQWQAYQAENLKGNDDANRDMAERSMRDMQWLQNARNKELKRLQREAKSKRDAVRSEVEAEVNAEPIQQALRFLKTGEIADGPDQVKVAKGHKLATPALEEMYPAGALGNADWKSLPRGTTAKEGMHPDIVAPIFGYRNGYDLVDALINVENAKEKIDAITDQRMLERHGELSDPNAIARAADEAIHNEARTRFVATELVALEKATGKKQLLLRAAKAYSKEAVGNFQVRQLKKANRYSVAERKAAKASEMALRRGDRAKAAQYKRSQLISNLIYRESLNARKDVEKALRFFNRFSREGTRKNLDQAYLDQIDQLLERYDLRPSVSQKQIDKRTSLNAWLESQRQTGIEPEIDAKLLNEASRIHYTRLTVDELRGLYDSIRSIDHVARLKKKLLTAKDEREFNARIDEAVESIEGNATKTVKEQIESNTTLDGFRKGKNEFFAMHRKMASVVRQLDGLKDGGAIWELLVRPMNERADMEAVKREAATMRLDEILRPIYSAGKMNRKISIPGVSESISIEGRFVMALNAGNEVNYQRLVEGEAGKRFTEAEIKTIFKSMSKQEWDAVQAVWDFIDEYWTDIAAKQRRVTGVTPVKVEATPVETPHGTYRGGYYPIKYNADRSQASRAHEVSQIYEQMKLGAYSAATTRRGHTKARGESGTGPLRYDLGGLFQHVDQVIHDLVWHEWSIDANRVIRNSKFDQAVRTHYGSEVVELFRKAHEDIITGDIAAQNRFEAFINHLRGGVSIVGMGWNVFTSALQPLGLTQSMVRIGPAHVGRGLAKWLSSGKNMQDSVDWIWDQSNFMRLRHKTLQREINEIRNKVAGKKLTNVQSSFFYFIVKAQQIADMPTWLGQYYKSMDGGEDHARAVALADQAVLDSQGGGQIKDLAQIQRGGPLLKIWTNFYSFFNTTYNLTAERVSQTNFKKPGDIGRLAVDFALLYALPATLAAFLRDAIYFLTGGDDEEKKEENLITWLARENISYLTGTMVGLREMSSVLQGHYGYSGPAGTRFFSDLSNLSVQISQGEVDESTIKALNKVAGTVFHYPAGQVERVGEGIVALAEDETDNPTVLLTGTE